jgi:hypothetical protein
VTRRTQHRVGPEHSSRVCRRTPSDRLQGVCGVLHVCMGRARWQMQRCATPECAVWRGRSFSISAAGDNHLQLHPQRARSSKTRDLVDQRWPPPLHARPRPDLSLHRTEGPLARLPMTTQAQGALISQQWRHGHLRTAAMRLRRDRRTGKYTPHELSKSHQTPRRRPRRAQVNHGWLICCLICHPWRADWVYGSSWRAMSASPFQATRAADFLLSSNHTTSAEA